MRFYEDTDPWMELEALESERFEADLLQARFEAEGREYSARLERARQLYAAGRYGEAAATCPHGWGYSLDAEYAKHRPDDPRAGEGGERCHYCGAAIRDGRIVAIREIPCEFDKEA